MHRWRDFPGFAHHEQEARIRQNAKPLFQEQGRPRILPTPDLVALALFRHYQPDFRVLIIAPRENIQIKWMKELRNFVAHNVRFPDLRVKALDGRPCRPLVACGNLLDLA